MSEPLAIALADSGNTDLNVVTSSLQFATVLKSAWQMILVGGVLEKEEMVIRSNEKYLRGLPVPWFTFLGIEQWSFEGGCTCGSPDVAFARHACLRTEGRVFILTDAGELAAPSREVFIRFDELEDGAVDYEVVCHTPAGDRERVEEERRKFSNPARIVILE